MEKDPKVSITAIRSENFEPRLQSEELGWHNPLEQIQQYFRQFRPLGEEEEEGVSGYRHRPVGDPDEEGYDGIGLRTFSMEQADDRFLGVNLHGLSGDEFARDQDQFDFDQ
jgi:hypothetical protein